jgi:hypothetical protein
MKGKGGKKRSHVKEIASISDYAYLNEKPDY